MGTLIRRGLLLRGKIAFRKKPRAKKAFTVVTTQGARRRPDGILGVSHEKSNRREKGEGLELPGGKSPRQATHRTMRCEPSTVRCGAGTALGALTNAQNRRLAALRLRSGP